MDWKKSFYLSFSHKANLKENKNLIGELQNYSVNNTETSQDSGRKSDWEGENLDTWKWEF